MGFCCTCSYSLLFSHSVVSNSLRPHELQHSRLPCPSLSPSLPKLMSVTQWWHPTVSSSVVPFPSCPQSFLASGSFPVSPLRIRWPKYWSFSISLSVNIQAWFPLGLTGLISLLSRGLSRVFSSTVVWKKFSSSVLSLLYGPTLSYVHDNWKIT